MPQVSFLSETELAERAGTAPERVRELAEHGILEPSGGEPGRPFRVVDVNRIRLADALEDSGMSLADLGRAIAGGHIALDFLDQLWPEPPGFVPGKTVREMAAEYGLPWELVESSQVRLGLPRPSPEDRIREDDVELYPAAQVLMGVGLDEAALVRFSRVMGENIRRLAEAQVHFFDQTVIQPMLRAGISEAEVWRMASAAAPQVTPLFEWLLLWLYRRQQEHYLLQDIVEHIESAMEDAGFGRARVARPPAIAFLDLSGFTRLTEEKGDDAAAELAGKLAELVQEATSTCGGKPVKLLGDGVMFHFPDAGQAVRCALQLVEEAPRTGLPPARVGVEAGPVVFQDGDYFGRTVNVAARIAAHAGPSDVLVSEAVVSAVGDDGLDFEEVGAVELKGVGRLVVLHRATRRPAFG
jgi:class 3 adenylate cyclase